MPERDVGSWSALWDLAEKDAAGNATRGDVQLQDTRASLVFGDRRLVATLGVDDLVIVDSDDAVHEKVLYAATPGMLQGDLLHDSAEDLGRYLEKQNRYTTLAAAELHRRGQHAGAMELVFSPLMRFMKFYVLRLGFLDGLPGLVHISIGCMNSFMKYAKLVEMRRAKGK